jgi:hypothetical protein
VAVRLRPDLIGDAWSVNSAVTGRCASELCPQRHAEDAGNAAVIDKIADHIR